MSIDVDVLGSYWTTAGPVEVHEGREWSLFDWGDRCAEAARVGMRGLGVWHADLEHQLERRGLTEIKRIFDDCGLRFLELEFLDDWFLDQGTGGRAASDKRRAMLFEAAAALDAHHVKVGNLFGTRCEFARVVDRFGELCADAAAHHGASLAYELIPFDVNANTLERVLRIVEGAAAENGGICLDTWHLGKLRIAPEELRRVPRRYLSYVELSDGMVQNMADPVAETTRYRRLPGEGEFDIRGYVEVLRDMGYDGPWGVEVLSEELNSRSIPDIFESAVATTVTRFSPPSSDTGHGKDLP